MITYFGHNEVLSMISYIEKNWRNVLCAKKRKTKNALWEKNIFSRFERKQELTR